MENSNYFHKNFASNLPLLRINAIHFRNKNKTIKCDIFEVLCLTYLDYETRIVSA